MWPNAFSTTRFQPARAIHDARQPRRHHRQQHADTIEQQHRPQCQLHRMSDIDDIELGKIEAEEVHEDPASVRFISTATRARSSWLSTDGPG